MRDPADELLRAEDHVGDGIVLTLNAIEDSAHHKRRRVDSRGDDRTKGSISVEAFGPCPLGEGHVAIENVGGRDIVDAGLPKDDGVRLIRRHASAGLADNNTELSLKGSFATI
jgi:hypothetical protein